MWYIGCRNRGNAQKRIQRWQKERKESSNPCPRYTKPRSSGNDANRTEHIYSTASLAHSAPCHASFLKGARWAEFMTVQRYEANPLLSKLFEDIIEHQPDTNLGCFELNNHSMYWPTTPVWLEKSPFAQSKSEIDTCLKLDPPKYIVKSTQRIYKDINDLETRVRAN